VRLQAMVDKLFDFVGHLNKELLMLQEMHIQLKRQFEES
jgi:hypothetical protein